MNTNTTRTYRIGCVTSSVSYHGGWDTLSKGIISAVSRVHGVVVLTARGTESDEVPYPVHAVLPSRYSSFGLLNQIRTAWQCLRYFQNCDAIHTFIEPLTPGAAFASWLMRKPLLMTLAGTYCVVPSGGSLRSVVKRTLMVFMYRRASFIATGSRQNIELIEREVSLAGKWEFVPFGVDLEKFTPRDGVSAPEHPFLLTVGSLKPRKGADYVIRALALIKDDVPDLHYYIVGSFDERNGFICQLQQLATENGLQERVHLLGRVSDEALRDMYQTCAVFVLAAQTVGGSFEGFPMVYYESQALGAPVIGTSGYGSDYIIHDGENGFLIPQENVTRLADAIRRIATDGVLRERMSVRARQEARRHSWSVIAKHYLVAYGRVTQS